MEKVRQAMEMALKEHWEPLNGPMRPASARRGRVAETPAAVTPPAHAQPATALQAPRVAPVSRDILLENRLVAAVKEHPQRDYYCLLQAAVSERLTKER
jgi:hypothetical protein